MDVGNSTLIPHQEVITLSQRTEAAEKVMNERHEHISFWLAIVASFTFMFLFAFALHNVLRYLVKRKGNQDGQQRVPVMVWSFYAVVLALTAVTAVLFGCLSTNPLQYFDFTSDYLDKGEDLFYITVLEGV